VEHVPAEIQEQLLRYWPVRQDDDEQVEHVPDDVPPQLIRYCPAGQDVQDEHADASAVNRNTGE